MNELTLFVIADENTKQVAHRIFVNRALTIFDDAEILHQFRWRTQPRHSSASRGRSLVGYQRAGLQHLCPNEVCDEKSLPVMRKYASYFPHDSHSHLDGACYQNLHHTV